MLNVLVGKEERFQMAFGFVCETMSTQWMLDDDSIALPRAFCLVFKTNQVPLS